jgi:hypothetical protein
MDLWQVTSQIIYSTGCTLYITPSSGNLPNALRELNLKRQHYNVQAKSQLSLSDTTESHMNTTIPMTI